MSLTGNIPCAGPDHGQARTLPQLGPLDPLSLFPSCLSSRPSLPACLPLLTPLSDHRHKALRFAHEFPPHIASCFSATSALTVVLSLTSVAAVSVPKVGLMIVLPSLGD